MFQRGWFHIDVKHVNLMPELLEGIRAYGPARVQPLNERSVAELSEQGRFAGLVLQLDAGNHPLLEQVLTRAPGLPVLAVLSAADRAHINRLQACAVETAILPLQMANVIGFAQRALAQSFVPSRRVARLIHHLARTRALTAREIQLLSYCLGDEPRARVRRRLGITENTLKTQIRGLLRKCGEPSLDSLAKNVLRCALSSEEPARADLPWAEHTRPMTATVGLTGTEA